jgi:hypothetical protein
MSSKKEIATYVDENIKNSFSKNIIKSSLLKSGYKEKEVMDILIERPEPKLLKENHKTQTWLIFFVIGYIVLRLLDGLIKGMDMSSEVGGDPTSNALMLGIISLILPIIFLINVIKSRAWSYVLFFFIGIYNIFINSIVILTLFFNNYSIPELIFTLIFMMIYLTIFIGMTITAHKCWKKIHPDYDIKHLFTTGVSTLGIIFIIFIVIILIGVVLSFIF